MDSKGKGKAKGKGIAGSDSGKRKRYNEDDFSGSRKRKNPGVLQFFEDAADVVDDDNFYDGLSDFENDIEQEFGQDVKIKSEPGKADDFPLLPKEEEPNEEEFDRMMEKRYREGLFVKYPEEDYEGKRSVESIPSAKEPNIWKVKCSVGRERLSAFCLMQKFVDLKSLGTKLEIISVFAIEHIKGFIYIEAEKQCDVIEACKGLSSIYSSRVAIVPKNEISHLLSVRSKHNEVSEGSWARVKNGKYKGDLAQVVSVNEARRRATIKLIPRIDLQAMAQKFGGGVTAKKGIPAPRLISSSELEEFRPLIQHRRDRETGKFFDFFDGLMLKDGYLYKKVSIDSLSCNTVTPSEQEVLKFRPSENFESDDPEWLSQLYGQQKKKQTMEVDKRGGKGDGSSGSIGKVEDSSGSGGKGEGSSGSGVKVEGFSKSGGKGEGSSKSGGKGEGSSGSSMANKYDLYDLVCFGRKDFGLILGMEKDNCYKILKGSDGPDVVSVDMKEIKSGPIDTKFTAFDRNTKNVSVNDLVKVAEGPSEGQQGTVKQVYRGILFLYDENETENGGYFCCKSSMCEKIKLSFDACSEKNDEAGSSGFGDFSSSPKSPLSPKKPWQARESNSNFNRGDNDSMFSVGQTLRIRVGPLKGYLCRVLAIRFSDVTVKLDSQHKVLTVKSEYLSEVRGRSSAMSLGDDTGSGSLKPFDLLGAEGSSGDWLDRAGASAGGDNRWNGGRPSAERSSWPSFNTSGISLQTQPNPANLFGSEESNLKDSNQNSTWGAAAAGKKPIGNGQVSGWNSWAKATVEDGSGNGGSDGWGATGDSLGSSKEAWNSCHNKETSEKWSNNDCAGGNTSNWNSSMPVAENPTGDCGNACRSWAQQEAETDQAGGWKKAKIGSGSETAEVGCTKNFGDDAAGWKKSGSSNEDQTESWSKPMASGNNGGTSWEKQDRGPSWGKQDGGSGWGKEGGSSWSKQETGFCGEQDGSSSWSKQGDSHGKQESGSSWSKRDGDASWSKQEGNHIKQDGGVCQKKDGGSSLSKLDGDSSWNKKDGNTQDWVSSWGKPDSGSSSKQGGGSWNKQDGGPSWSKQDKDSSWSKLEENQSKQDVVSLGRKDGDSLSKQDGVSLGKQGGGSTWSKQDGGSSWSRQDGDSKQHGGSSWSKQDGGSWNKQGGGSTWSEQDGGPKQDGDSWNKQGGGSTWSQQGGGSKQEGGSWNKQGGGSTWSQQGGGSKQEGGSWNKQGGGSTWSKQDGGSSWSKQDGDLKQDGGSWNKQGGGSTWSKQEGGSSWSKQDGDSKQDGGSWNKQGRGSTWSKQEGGSSWSKQDGDFKQDGGSSWSRQDGSSSNKQGGGSNWRKQGGSSWSKQDGGSWNKQGEKCNLDRGRGSGGRRGGFRGARNQFGRGRSFDRGQSHSSQPESGPANSFSSEYNVRKDWNQRPVVNRDQVGGWSSWSKANSEAGSGGNASESWGKAAVVAGDPISSSKDAVSCNKQDGGSWDQEVGNFCGKKDESSGWGKQDGDSGCGKPDGGCGWGKQEGSWNKEERGFIGGGQDGDSGWGKQDEGRSWEKDGNKDEAGTGSSASDGWGKATAVAGDPISSLKDAGGLNKQDGGSWGQHCGNSGRDKKNAGSGWGKQGGGSWGQQGGNSDCDRKDECLGWGKQDGGSGWGKKDAGSSWGKQEGSWNKEEGGSSGGRQEGGSGWGKQGGGSWGQQGGNSGCDKKNGGLGCGKQDGSSGRGKGDAGSSWGKQEGSWNKEEGGSSGGKQEEGSGWGKQDGGSSWGQHGEGSGKQERSWSEARNSGRRGGGFRGGRNQFGRGGRSFNQDQSSGWNKRG